MTTYNLEKYMMFLFLVSSFAYFRSKTAMAQTVPKIYEHSAVWISLTPGSNAMNIRTSAIITVILRHVNGANPPHLLAVSKRRARKHRVGSRRHEESMC